MGNRARKRQRRLIENAALISGYNKGTRKIWQSKNSHAKATRRRRELYRLQKALKKANAWKKEDGALVRHAKRELELSGGNLQDFPAKDILDMVRLFSSQGHSGSSAWYSVNVLTRLLSLEPLSPITDRDEDWVHVYTREDGTELYQNSRYSSLFKEGNVCYDIDGAYFIYEDGLVSSRAMIVELPYIPTKPVDWNTLPDSKKYIPNAN